jgi:hypothetical protein
VSAKKLVTSTYLQYVIVALGVLLLFAFWMLFATLAATAIYGVVGAIFTVAIIVATLCYARETPPFEHWRKTLIAQGIPETSASASSEKMMVAQGYAKDEV